MHILGNLTENERCREHVLGLRNEIYEKTGRDKKKKKWL